jgi:DHA3 family macrolide efflux protein-like MFS transporter
VSFRNLRLVRALSHRPIFVLWTGEALSAIGDEVYKVALVWLAVKMVGADAGYLAAGQAAAVLLFGLVGGIWADHWDPRRTMLNVDLIRGALVLIPVAWVYFLPLNLPILIFVALSVASLSAFFEPAMQAVIPRLAPGRELMQATNGLMGTTSRLARTVGPAMIGSLTAVIPTIHFFTLDAITFGFSAWAVAKLKKDLPPDFLPNRPRVNPLAAIGAGFALIKGNAPLKYVLYSKAVASGCWNIVLPLGVALLVQKVFPGDVRVYGWILAAYGSGNLAGALVLSNVSMDRPYRTMGLGFALLGAGFIGLTLAPNLPLMMLAVAAAAVGGPMNDLAHIDIIQRSFKPEQLVRVVRFRMAVEFTGITASLALAPTLFRLFDPHLVIALAGAGTLAAGVIGFVRFRERPLPERSPARTDSGTAALLAKP